MVAVGCAPELLQAIRDRHYDDYLHGRDRRHSEIFVNFPLLEAVFAGLWEQRSRDRWTYWTSAISLGIAMLSLAISVLVATGKLG